MASQFYILCKLFGVSIEGMFAARGGCENPGGARIRPLQLRWLREILLVSRPPLLCEEGNAHAQGSSHTDFHELRRSEVRDRSAVRDAQARQRAASSNRPPLQ